MLNVGVVLQGTFRHAADKTTVTVDLVNVSDESALWTGSFVLPADGNFAIGAGFDHGGGGEGTPHPAVGRRRHRAGATRHQRPRGVRPLPQGPAFLRQARRRKHAAGDRLLPARHRPRHATLRAPTPAWRCCSRCCRRTCRLNGDSLTLRSRPPRPPGAGDRPDAVGRTPRPGRRADHSGASRRRRAGIPGGRRRRPAQRDRAPVARRQSQLLARTDDAIREGRAAVDLDPLSAVADNDLAYDLIGAGQFAEAIRVARRALEIDSTLDTRMSISAIAFAFAGKLDSATADASNASSAAIRWRQMRARVSRLGIRAGRTLGRGRTRARRIERTIRGGSRDIDLVIANVALGNKDAALDALERAARARSFYASNVALGCDPTFDPLKSEPRFIAAVKQMGQVICPQRAKWPIPARTKP